MQTKARVVPADDTAAAGAGATAAADATAGVRFADAGQSSFGSKRRNSKLTRQGTGGEALLGKQRAVNTQRSGSITSHELAHTNDTHRPAHRDRYAVTEHHPLPAFNTGEFFATLLCEALPNLLAVPAVYLVEGAAAGWHVCSNRLYIPNPAYAPGFVCAVFSLLFHPLHFWFYGAVVLWVLDAQGVREEVLFVELLPATICYACRWLVIATKYAYYSEMELSAMRVVPPNWSFEHTARKLIGAGWMTPLKFPGLLEEQLHDAEIGANVDLMATNVRAGTDRAAAMRALDALVRGTKELAAGLAAHEGARGDGAPAPAQQQLPQEEERGADSIIEDFVSLPLAGGSLKLRNSFKARRRKQPPAVAASAAVAAAGGGSGGRGGGGGGGQEEGKRASAPPTLQPTHTRSLAASGFLDGHEFPASNGVNGAGDVTAGALAMALIKTTFGQEPPSHGPKLCAALMVLLAATQPAVNALLGVPAFGTTSAAQVVLGVSPAVCFLVGAGTMNFVFVAAHDFNRRARCMELLLRVTMAPGVPLRELCAGQVKELRATLLQLGAKLDGRQARVSAAAGGGGGGGEEAAAEHGVLLAALDAFESGRGLGRRRLWLDLKDPDNCFAFVLLRRALRIVGLNYKLRGSFYVGLFAFALFFVLLMLNLLIWTQSECSLSFIAQALVLTAVLMTVVVYCVRAAARVQAVVPQQRDAIQVELLALHKNLSDLQRHESALLQQRQRQRDYGEGGGGGAAPGEELPSIDLGGGGGGGVTAEQVRHSIGALERAERLLADADAMIAYQEEVCAPSNVMGFAAGPNLIKSIVAATVTGLFMAFQGYIETGTRFLDNGRSAPSLQ